MGGAWQLISFIFASGTILTSQREEATWLEVGDEGREVGMEEIEREVKGEEAKDRWG